VSKTAHILAIRRASLGDLGFGISSHTGDVDHIFTEGEAWVGPRPVLEEDEDFVQPIPYVVMRKGDNVLAYTRGQAGGEGRLHDKVSVGFGGHIDLEDIARTEDGAIDLKGSVWMAVIRELLEELGIEIPVIERIDDTWAIQEDVAAALTFRYVISSDASAVDRVHVGLCCVVDYGALVAADVELKHEDAIENAQWANPWELLRRHTDGEIQLETWSELVLTQLINS
jgi:predicted NUDIX family phosphoesterase